MTLILVLIGITFSALWGIIVGICRLSKNPLLRYLSLLCILFIRGVPFITFLFWVFFTVPIALKIKLSPFNSVVIALVLFHGTYIAEIVRGGLQAVPMGQREAGISTGLSGLQIMIHIILPQALRIMIPPFLNRFITLFISTSVVYVVGVMEFMRTAVIVNNRELRYPVEIFLFVAMVYFACAYGLSRISKTVEDKMSRGKIA